MPSSPDLWWTAITGTLVLLFLVACLIFAMTSHHKRLLQAQRDKMEILRAGEERYRDLFNNVTDIVFVHELDGRLSQVNDVLSRLLRLPPEEVQGKSILDFLEHRHHSRFYLYLNEIKKYGSSEGFIPLRAPSGERYVFEYRNSLIRKDGKSVAVRGIARNVTERIRAQQELKKSERRHRRLSDLSPAPMFVCVHGNIRYANKAGLDLLGVDDVRKILGKSIAFFVEASESYIESYGVPTNGQTRDGQLHESKIRRLNGEFRDVNISTIRTTYEGEDALQLVLVDISRQKLLQKELVIAHRLETAGRLAGQIAHDFNNLLAPLTAFPAIIREEVPFNSKIQELTKEMETSARRIAEINQQLLTLGRRGHYSMEVLDLHDLIRSTLEVCNVKGEISLKLKFCEEELFIRAGHAQLARAFINLIKNAAEAMHGSGTLTLTTSNEVLSKPLPGYDDITPGPYARFEIEDTGPGIKSEHLDKIFEPFFTTKAMDGQHGSGLGLSIVKNVLEDHGGFVTVNSIPGKGALFAIYLPRVVDARPQPAGPAEIEFGEGERILLVDDDPLQLKVTGQFLEKIGYQVFRAQNGPDAIKSAREHEPDLLILDMSMGGMGGTETYEEILRHRKNQKAILLSGFAETEDVRKGLELGAGAFVRKPVIPYDLALVVRKELNTKR